MEWISQDHAAEEVKNPNLTRIEACIFFVEKRWERCLNLG